MGTRERGLNRQIDLTRVAIIPAQPGYYTIHRYGDDIWVGDPIIAWSLEYSYWQVERPHPYEDPVLHVDTRPIVDDQTGRQDEGVIGFVRPEGALWRYLLFEGGTFETLEKLIACEKGDGKP